MDPVRDYPNWQKAGRVLHNTDLAELDVYRKRRAAAQSQEEQMMMVEARVNSLQEQTQSINKKLELILSLMQGKP